MQEDKEGFFDTVDTLQTTIEVFGAMLLAWSCRRIGWSRWLERAGCWQRPGQYLVGKGVPFREAHGIMRELCRHCDEQGIALQELPIEDYRRFSHNFDNSVYEITATASAAARDIPGGTAPGRVAEALGWRSEFWRRRAMVSSEKEGGVLIAPSVLSADFGRLAEQVQAATEAGADLITWT